jgi:hypothetical protein
LTLKLNGREYLETTSLENFLTAVQKLADQYGERSTNASKTDVDWKSLMHAVRVYQQVLELLNTGTISFPRENTDYLLQIRRGELTLDAVKDNLRKLDDLVNATLATTNLPEVTESFKDEVEDVLHAWLKALY